MNGAAFQRPTSLDQALALLGTSPHKILAGGTDFYAAQGIAPVSEAVLDISALAPLRGLREEAGVLRIGATTTWSDLVRAPMHAQFRGLQAAAREVGGVQVQNRGTVAGNLCNASPAADGTPALLALDAQVELQSRSGPRVLALSDFVLGSRRTARRDDELVTALLVPLRPKARSSFLKLGHRRYLVISVAMVSALLEIDASGCITHAALAVGSCSAVAQRLRSLEARCIGRKPQEVMSLITEDDLKPLTPIDDVRGTAEYRRDAVRTLIARAVVEASHE